jgi:hypothetical protein
MFWVMMNVDNPDLGLLLTHQLGNTAVVVVDGNPEDGWTLENWDGVEVSAEPNLATRLFVDVRNVVTAPQTAAYRIGQAFATGDITAIANAIRDGVVDVATKVVGFIPKVVGDVVGSLQGPAPVQSGPPASSNPTVLSTAAKTRASISAVDPAKDVPKTKHEKANGATDLTDGNKAEPGKREPTTIGADADDHLADVVTITDTTGPADTVGAIDSATKADATSDAGGSQQAAA